MLAAALVLTVISVVRNHRPVELVGQLAVLALLAVRITGVARRARARGRRGARA